MSSPKSHSPNVSQALTYSDIVDLFSQENLADNFKEACSKFALFQLKILQSFESLNKQFSSLDLQQKLSPSLAPTWDCIQKDFVEILRQHRLSAGLISGRLKMFCSLMLPRTAGNINPKSPGERMQVLQSYMAISSDHATLTYNLVERTLKATDKLHEFHTELSKHSCQRGASNSEMQLLITKLEQLKGVVKQLCISVSVATFFGSSPDENHRQHSTNMSPDPSLLASVVLRCSATSVRRSSRRSSLSQRITLVGPEAGAIGKLYDQLEDAKNGLAQAHYSLQLSCRRTDSLNTARTTLSNLLSDGAPIIPTSLGLFMIIWATLKADCISILAWLKDENHTEPPSCVKTYLKTGKTLYTPLADALDGYVAVLDSHFRNRM